MTRPKIVIMRGCSGSGKSTFVDKLIRTGKLGEAVVCSADHYFLKRDEYIFDPTQLQDAHAACFQLFLECLSAVGKGTALWDGYDSIVVDNTNMRLWELSPYRAAALALTPDSPIEYYEIVGEPDVCFERNAHGVPLSSIVRQYESYEELPPYWIRTIDDYTVKSSEELREEKCETAISWFSGPYRFLSNFYTTPVVYRNLEYPSAEHAYQAAKCRNPLDRSAFAKNITAGEAKRLGRSIPLRKDWEKVKLLVMEDVLRSKFEHPKMRNLLLSTGTAELIEGNNWGDIYWGTVNGKGENHLGRLLMKIRASLRG